MSGRASEVRAELSDRVLTITLDRPAKLNAFTLAMSQQVIEAFDRADADDEVRAVVVTGAGRAFCAGADLSSGGATFDYDRRAAETGAETRAETSAEVDPRRDRGGVVALRIFESLKPVIGAINGAAVGVGATMTLPMDVRLASTTARYGFVFARRGIVPEAASSWFLPRLVGISRAVEWAVTGRLLDADEALAGGLVRSVHEPDDLLPAAYALAREIADNAAPVSVAMARQMMWRGLGADHPMEAHRADSRAMIERGRSADAREGVGSFLEKRTAQFPDRVSDGFRPWWPDRPFTPLEVDR